MAADPPAPRVTRDGEHLALAGVRFRVRGVTYGSFLPRGDGHPFPTPGRVREDLAQVAALGCNVVRTYSLPPVDLLDAAAEQGLHVLVGLDHHDWRFESQPTRTARRRIRDAGRRAVDEAMERCAGRRQVLAISVGNEVPADLVRVHGIGHVSDHLAELIDRVHAADPGMLATYTNYPTTEYLDVPGQDLATFNVFLERPGPFRRYVRHLQAVTGDLPLVLTELGLPADVHGQAAQAATLDWQLRELDEAGCAGATVFSWTDEWGVGGQSVTGWGFGVTDHERRPKPAADVVGTWTRRELAGLRDRWPRVSVIVCAYDEEAHLEACLRSLERVTYPDLEVIVCDDGSTDRTLEIARRFPFRVLDLPHAGLSVARNAGLAAATGEVVAYLDADAACAPDWPFHLALSLEDPSVVATGGPNLPWPSAGLVERAVALSPGNPCEVLVGADRAEHVPGCNMAFRREALEAIGGFDAAYTAAGDDVDVCWRLLDGGGDIGFSPAAQVFHHRRGTVRGYLRQQRGYGKAERMVAGRHPHRFNRLGQARWSGFIYGGARLLPGLLRPVVYHGPMGSGAFQGVVRRPSETTMSLAGALLPLVVLVGLVLGPLAGSSPWWSVAPLAALLTLVGYGTAAAVTVPVDRREPRPLRVRALAGLLHVLQPLVRTWGRVRARRLAPLGEPTEEPVWTGDRLAWLADLSHRLRRSGCVVRASGPESPWDLLVGAGPLVRCRVTTAICWGWVPQWRVSWRPGWLTLLLLPIVAVSLIVTDRTQLVGTLALVALVGTLVEGVRLRTRVHAAVAATTPDTASRS